MKLELADEMYTHRVLCTLGEKAHGVLCSSIKEGNVFISMLYGIHKMKNRLGATKTSLLVLRLRKCLSGGS